VKRKFSAQRVLVALHSIDFVNGQIELKRQAVDGLTGRPDQLELGVAEPSPPDVELGIKVVATVHLSDAAKTVGSVYDVAVSPVVQRGSGVCQVAENQRLIGLVLEANDYIDDFVTACRTGTKVGNGRRKVASFIAERLVAAERALSRVRSGRGSLSLGGARHSKRTEREKNCHNTKNPKNR